MRMNRLKAAACLAAVAGLAGVNTANGQVFSSSPNAPISDNQTTIDQIQVSGVANPIGTMAVTLNLFHTWTADLDIVLVRNGQTLELSTDNGGSGDNMLGTRFIDSAAISITAGVAPFTGDYRPEGTTPAWLGAPIPQVFLANFAGFSGQDANGTWELYIYDDAGGDIGTLTDWSIDFNPGAPPPPPPGPPGDNCVDAFPVADGIVSFSTIGALPQGPGACGASAGSPDIFYLWTPDNSGCATIETCGTAWDTVLEIVSACGGVSVACNDDACGLQSRLSLTNVTAGVPIIVRVSGYNGASGAGQISFLSSPSTPYSAPSGTPEGEPCIEAQGDTYNAGCNSTPPSYLPLSRCQTYVGTSWYNTAIGFRDTDWYEFTLAEAQTVTVTGQARFAAQLYFLEVIDCASGQISVISSANNTACTPDFTMSASLPAGTWYVFVGPTFTSAVSCGSGGEDYWFTLSYGDECSGGGECDPDFNQDGNVDQDDIACLAQVVAGDPSCSGNDPDFNGDGNVDQDDVAALEQVVGGAPCP